MCEYILLKIWLVNTGFDLISWPAQGFFLFLYSGLIFSIHIYHLYGILFVYWACTVFSRLEHFELYKKELV